MCVVSHIFRTRQHAPTCRRRLRLLLLLRSVTILHTEALSRTSRPLLLVELSAAVTLSLYVGAAQSCLTRLVLSGALGSLTHVCMDHFDHSPAQLSGFRLA